MSKQLTHGISVKQFCQKHELSKQSLFTLAHSHSARIPDTIKIAGRLRIVDPFNKTSGIFQGLSLNAEQATDELSEFLDVDALCQAFDIDAETLLQLTLDKEMPRVFQLNGNAVFPSKSVVHWSMKKRADFIQGLI